MDFRILFTGRIPTASRTKTRSAEKHSIRKAFHPQLRRLWHSNAQLRMLAASSVIPLYTGSAPEATDERVEKGLENIGKIWEKNGFKFIPLVTENILLHCSIDILLLRPHEERFIFQQADIDGQLKTLLDAFKMPSDPQDIGDATPDTDEDPFFCLLQDDRLVSEIKVTSQELLLLPGERDVKANDAFAVINVILSDRYPAFIPNLAYASLIEGKDVGTS